MGALPGLESLVVGRCSFLQTKAPTIISSSALNLLLPRFQPSNHELGVSTGGSLHKLHRSRNPSTSLLTVSCSSRPPSPDSSGNESKAILDAFFLGKALAESVNERVGSAVGEFLSVIGQWQAEQQKQAMDFQDEVLERARRAKAGASREVTQVQPTSPETEIVSSSDERGDASSASTSLPYSTNPDTNNRY